MTAMRAALVAITILVLAVVPLVVPGTSRSSGGPAVYAAPAESPSLDDNRNRNDNDDDDDDNRNRNDNDDDDNRNRNDNNDDDNRNRNDNGNDNDDDDNAPPPILVGQPGGVAVGSGGGSRGGLQPVTGTTKCFDVQEVGLVQRALGEGNVTVAVPPDAGFSSITRLSLNQVAVSTVPAPPAGATVVGGLVFSVDAQAGCSGPAITTLSNGANLGVTYRTSADKSKLRIVMLQGGQWMMVTTVPDPANPYISATITSGGTYAVVQVP